MELENNAIFSVYDYTKTIDGNVHSRRLLTYNCLPTNAGLLDFSNAYPACTLMSEERPTL